MINRYIKRLIIIVLILSLGIPYFSFAGTADTRYYESSCTWETYNDNPDLFGELKGLPAGTTEKAMSRPFNYRVWFAKGLVSYGTPEQANVESGVRINYKEDTINPSGVGFYKKSGKGRGEYRYHGFTIDGNLFTNQDFPNDTVSSLTSENKPWIYRYWDSNYVKTHFAGEPSLVESSFNYAAIQNSTYVEQKTREWINTGMNAFKIRNGVKDTGLDDPAPEQKTDGTWDFYNFTNVLSAPSAKFSGEGRMFRLTSSRGLFYQTFTIQKYKKEHTLVNVSVDILNQSDLVFEDFGADNPSDFDTQTINVKVQVTATLKDETYIADIVKKAVYYTREDRDYWTIKLDGAAATKSDIQIFDNKAKTVFTIPMSKGQIKALSGGSKSFTAVARCIYFDKEFDEGSKHGSAAFSVPVVGPPPGEEPPIIIQPECVIPNVGFDIVPFPARDNTDMSQISNRSVYINGSPVNASQFFSGNYVFGIGEDGLKKIDVYYTSIDGSPSFYTGWAYIYDTKPNAQFKISGSYKQNRKLTATDNCGIGNVKIVTDSYPITNYSWSFGAISGDDSSRKMRDLGSLKKELMYKKPGSYEITLTVTNSLGRVSDPYVFDFEIFPDYQPAVEIDLNNSVVTRNEKVSTWNYAGVSTDNDIIASNTIELWYDSNNDGAYDQLLNTYDGKNGFPEYTPSKLGKYKFVDKVVEGFGEETLPEFITPGDTVSKTVEREFLVDNLVPLTGLYVQIPVVRPQVDVYIMMDSNLDNTKVNYAKNNRVNFDNFLRSANILSDVELWDMHTYTYTQPASTAVHTGSSYPAATTTYSSNGYDGTLDRTSVSNNSYQTDEGHYTTQTESKTATAGGQSTSGHGISSSSPPSSVSYSSGGFSGSLSGYGYSYSSSPCGHTEKSPPHPSGYFYWSRSYSGYSGTVSRSVQVWVPNLVSHNDYTGNYSGTIYKNVRQPYTDPFRSTSSKYVVYVTDGNITDLADLKAVMSKTDAKLILIGQTGAKSQTAYDSFILNDRPVEQVLQTALDNISLESPAAEEYTVLAGTDTFTLNVSDFDEENDAIIERKLQYVQDQNYFDNPTGMESFAVSAYSDSSGWVDNLATKFTKTGKYTVYRRIEDQPSIDPAFSGFSKYSGTPQMVIYAHRKPIALATLAWDYNSASNTYETSWVDQSYDLDHQYNRPDKGIVERKIMYRVSGGEWQYKIPNNLSPGTYELQYLVKDPEGAWSDPFVMNFTLSPAPPIQLDGKLRTLDNSFSTASVPASEFLEVYEAWTRYPYNVYLDSAMYNGAAKVVASKIINYSAATGLKDDNDINWFNYTYQIPNTLPDRSYTFRISAMGDFGQTKNKDFTVNVVTPINLTPAIPTKLSSNKTNQIPATTTKYANSTTVTLYKGTSYQTAALAMTGTLNGNINNWLLNYSPPNNVPDGTYTAEFRATTPNGNTDIKTVTFQLVHNSPPTVHIDGTDPGYVYEGDNVSFKYTPADPDNNQILNATYVLKKSGTQIWSGSGTINPNGGGGYSQVTQLMQNGMPVGSYSITVTVTDPFSASSSDTYNFSVYGLGVAGSVNHTTLWDQHRQNYNISKSGSSESPRAYDTFFPGEKFLLQADTTFIDSSRPDLVASSVRCDLVGTSYFDDLGLNSGVLWTGEIWDESMIRWSDRNLQFLFTVTYSNGTVKTDTVNVKIIDDEYWRLHRKF